MSGSDNSLVEIQLTKRIQDGSLYLSVFVRSERRPSLQLMGILEHEKTDQGQKVGMLAGALSEELCERYADTIDPSIAAREAIGAYRRLMDRARLVLGDELPRDADQFIINSPN